MYKQFACAGAQLAVVEVIREVDHAVLRNG
jgi:hypothetical protein